MIAIYKLLKHLNLFSYSFKGPGFQCRKAGANSYIFCHLDYTTGKQRRNQSDTVIGYCKLREVMSSFATAEKSTQMQKLI